MGEHNTSLLDDPDAPDPGDDDFLEYHRDRIEEFAESDAQYAWVFQRLLDSIEA